MASLRETVLSGACVAETLRQGLVGAVKHFPGVEDKTNTIIKSNFEMDWTHND